MLQMNLRKGSALRARFCLDNPGAKVHFFLALNVGAFHFIQGELKLRPRKENARGAFSRA